MLKSFSIEQMKEIKRQKQLKEQQEYAEKSYYHYCSYACATQQEKCFHFLLIRLGRLGFLCFGCHRLLSRRHIYNLRIKQIVHFKFFHLLTNLIN